MRIHPSIKIFFERVRSYRLQRPRPFDVIVFVVAAAAITVGVIFTIWLIKRPTLVIHNNRPDIAAAYGPIAGLPCPDPTLRPIAVMLASDPEARPLSGLRKAEIVFEAPVTPNGITRIMAVFQCADPKEVGSVRSARSTFVPLAQGFNALYAHWGGERDILADLDAGIIDNVDALKYEGTVYYRKSGIPRPHNGFTTLAAIRTQAEALGYTATVSLQPYLHADARNTRNLGSIADTIAFPGPPDMDVVFRYDSENDVYRRWRNNTPEIDREDDLQVAPRVVIVMEIDISRTYDQYMDLITTGTGNAIIYQQGRSTVARWEKRSPESPLRFLDQNGKDIAFAPGQIWVTLRTHL